MSTRTPGLQNRSQYHRNWGNYADGGQTTPANGTLPNQAAAPLADPEFSKLEAGDTAYVTTTDAGYYYCQDPGTVGGGDAVWVMLASGGAVVQTIRDAHEIVVGQSTAPYSNVLTIDADVLEPGDGTGIEAALASAGALVAGGYQGADVRLRPMDTTLDPAALTAVPIPVPSRVRLVGAGKSATLISGGDGAAASSQAIFALGGFSALEDMRIQSPAAAASPAPGTFGLIHVNGTGVEIKDCEFALASGGASPRDNANIIVTPPGASDRANLVIRNCEFEMDDALTNESLNAVAVSLGQVGADPNPDDNACVIRECRFLGGNKAIFLNNWRGGAQIDGVEFFPSGPRCIGIDWLWDFSTTNFAQAAGPRINNVVMTMQPDSAAVAGDCYGIRVRVLAADIVVFQTRVDNVDIQWPSPDLGTVVERIGVLFEVESAAGRIDQSRVSNVSNAGPVNGAVFAFDFAYRFNVISGGTSRDCGYSNCQSVNGDVGYSFDSTPANGIDNVRVVGGSATDGDTGVNIDTGVENTIVLGNQLTGNATAGITDAGTGTESAHNII